MSRPYSPTESSSTSSGSSTIKSSNTPASTSAITTTTTTSSGGSNRDTTTTTPPCTCKGRHYYWSTICKNTFSAQTLEDWEKKISWRTEPWWRELKGLGPLVPSRDKDAEDAI
ncbi:hypothetical protein B0H65DRAFT_547111 [Neurospora tetraspora]|uniref:Uncharacterized protein n=1 Tax=Neurospora tetraspora TaxID=94610 RepID=A0AAE0MVK8_9PEZI|nr:hypothetical protein B0H65DRAFT_547111 [Neurospora tetraspora]